MAVWLDTNLQASMLISVCSHLAHLEKMHVEIYSALSMEFMFAVEKLKV